MKDILSPSKQAAPLLLTVPEAADLLGLNYQTLYKYVREGRLPDRCVVRLGRTVRISRPALVSWVAAGAPDPREQA